jgi:hypothetical protein
MSTALGATGVAAALVEQSKSITHSHLRNATQNKNSKEKVLSQLTLEFNNRLFSMF